MPTFDITSTFDKQEVTNAVDQMNRELVNRYDFRGTNTTALLSENNITIKSSTEERMNAADQVLKEKFAKRNVSIKFLSNFEDEKQNLDLMMKTIKNVYKQYTKVPAKKLGEILKHDLLWDAKTCKEYGLIDEII